MWSGDEAAAYIGRVDPAHRTRCQATGGREQSARLNIKWTAESLSLHYCGINNWWAAVCFVPYNLVHTTRLHYITRTSYIQYIRTYLHRMTLSRFFSDAQQGIKTLWGKIDAAPTCWTESLVSLHCTWFCYPDMWNTCEVWRLTFHYIKPNYIPLIYDDS